MIDPVKQPTTPDAGGKPSTAPWENKSVGSSDQTAKNVQKGVIAALIALVLGIIGWKFRS